MGLFKAFTKGMSALEKVVYSETGQKIIERAEQQKAYEKAREQYRTTGINGLRCSIEKLVNNAGVICCEGTVNNIGRATYEKAVVTVEFRNSENSIVDKRAEYVVFNTLLYPGESTSFRALSTAKNIHSAQVFISDYKEC